jgi:hypothetical protein
MKTDPYRSATQEPRPGRRLAAVLVLLGAFLGTFAAGGPAHGQPGPPPVRPIKTPPSPGLWGKSALGGHLGPWFSGNLGDDFAGTGVRLSAAETAFHLEFFYQPHLTGIVNLDFNFGAVSRGDLRVTSGGSSFFGDVTLYPLGAGVILFPLAGQTGLRLQPSVRIGGTMMIGTERLQDLIDDYYGIGISSESRIGWGGYAGGGLSWLLSPSVALTGSVKYQYAKFDDELFGVRDFSGVQVLFGAAYLYR